MQSRRHASIVLLASARDRNQRVFRHSSRNRPLNDSTKALSVGLPGRKKSSVTPVSYAQRSKAFEMNFGPLPTRMARRAARIDAIRSMASTICSPLMPWSPSIAPVSYDPSIKGQHRATAPLADRMARLNIPDDLALPSRPQTSFDSASCRMCLSRLSETASVRWPQHRDSRISDSLDVAAAW